MSRLPDILILTGAAGLVGVGFSFDVRAGLGLLAGIVFVVGLAIDCCSAMGARK